MIDGWIFLVILYIIFMVFSALVRKSKLRKTTPSRKKEASQKNLQATFESYVDKIEDYLSAKQPPPLPQQPSQTSKILSVSKQPQRRELYPETTQPETSPVRRLVQEEIPLPELQLPSSPKSEAAPKTSTIFSFDKHRSYIQGIIMAELLGPPVSKKRRREPR
jgi:hypothetical protein